MSSGTHPNPRPIRVASMSENPGNRRINGGGTTRIVFHLLPAFVPEIVAFYDAGFRPLSTANPARRGELVTVLATGLGPVHPGTAPPGTEVFTADPLQEVNSPVEVLVNGRPAEVVNKVGWPGETEFYRIDFRLPAETEPGSATVRLSAAWIDGPARSVPVR